MLYGTPRSTALEIPRLDVRRLLDGAPSHIVVVAERGLGKSVAVAQWARDPGRHGVWVSVDAEIRERDTFWSRVLGFAEDLATESGVDSGRRPVSTSDIRRDVVRWARSLSQPFILVVDRSELLSEIVFDDLAAAARIPGGLQIVVISQGTVDVLDGPTIIGTDELLLSTAETGGLLRAAGVADAEQTAPFVRGAVGGHPRLTVAVSLDLARRQADARIPAAMVERIVTREVERLVLVPLASAGHVDVRLLRSLALLGHASIDEGVALTREDAASVVSVLEDAASAGIGDWTADGGALVGDGADSSRATGGTRFRFSPVAARTLAEPVRSSRAQVETLRRAAMIRAGRGEVFEAVSLLIDARDFDRAVTIGSDAIVELVSLHTEPLLGQLSQVPRSELMRHPLVVLFVGLLHAQRPRGRVAMLAHYAWADQLSRSAGRNARPAQRAVLVIARSAALRLLGQDQWAASAAKSAVASLDSASAAETEAIGLLAPIILGQAALALFSAGEVASSRELAVRTATTNRSIDRARHHAWSKAALIESVFGDMVAAADRAEAARKLDRWADYFFRVPLELAEIVHEVEAMRLSNAAALLDELGPRVMTTEFWPTATVARTFILLADGRAESAVEGLRRALGDTGAAPIPTRARRLLSDVLAIALLAHGDPTAARSVLRTSHGGSARPTVAAVLIRLVSDAPTEAIALATSALRTKGSSERSTASFAVLRAVAALRSGYRTAALRDVRTVLDLAESTGLRTPWALIPAGDRRGMEGLAADIRGASSPLVEELGRVPVLLSTTSTKAALTRRESEVMGHILAGRTNADIGDVLGVSLNTVRKQRASAYRKLGASNRDEAIGEALARGLFDLDE